MCACVGGVVWWGELCVVVVVVVVVVGGWGGVGGGYRCVYGSLWVLLVNWADQRGPSSLKLTVEVSVQNAAF
jgi:hypothetical protein